MIVCKTGNLAETNFTKRTGKGSVMNWTSAYIQAVATLSSRYAIFSNSTEGTTTWNTISGMTRTLRDHWSLSIPIFDEVEGLLDQHENEQLVGKHIKQLAIVFIQQVGIINGIDNRKN